MKILLALLMGLAASQAHAFGDMSQGDGQTPSFTTVTASTVTLTNNMIVPNGLTISTATSLFVPAINIGTDGKVGISTLASTAYALTVLKINSAQQAIFVNTASPSATAGGAIAIVTASTPTAAGQRLGVVSFGHTINPNGVITGAISPTAVTSFSAEAWTEGTSSAADLRLETTPIGSTTRLERARITSTGTVVVGFISAPDTTASIVTISSVGVGTTAPDKMLSVAGAANFKVASSTFGVGGVISLIDYTQVVTTTTQNATELYFTTMTVPANVLARNHDAVRVTCFFNMSQGTNNHTVRLRANNGGVTEYLLETGQNDAVAGGQGMISHTMIRTSAGNQVHGGFSLERLLITSGNTASTTYNGTTAFDETALVNFNCTGQTNGVGIGDVSFLSMSIEFIPAP